MDCPTELQRGAVEGKEPRRYSSSSASPAGCASYHGSLGLLVPKLGGSLHTEPCQAATTIFLFLSSHAAALYCVSSFMATWQDLLKQ